MWEWNNGSDLFIGMKLSEAHILKCYSIVVYLRIVLYINSFNTCCCNFHCFPASLEQGLYMLQHVPRRAVHFSFSRLVDKDLCLFSHRMHSIWNVVRQYWRSDCDFNKQSPATHWIYFGWYVQFFPSQNTIIHRFVWEEVEERNRPILSYVV